MKLSVLDQAPVSTNQTAFQALNDSVRLAQAAEHWGFTRYWIAEHHSFPGLACSAPEVLLSYIGAKTQHIRIGSGALLLPHYKPYKVAEVANTLATLFPGRIDLGIGRAPGGSAEATNALSDHFLQEVWNMPDKLKELLYFIDREVPADHPSAKVVATPIPDVPPNPWLLGTNKKSARLAAANGLPYAFGLFMSESDGREIIEEYRAAFKPRKLGDQPQVILTVSILCAETTEQAEAIALSNEFAKEQINNQHEVDEAIQIEKKEDLIKKIKRNNIIGSRSEVKVKVQNLFEQYNINEVMVLTNTKDFEDRLKSYELLASCL